MVTVKLVSGGTVEELDAYADLDSAVCGTLACGWEDDADGLLPTLLLVQDQESGTVLGTITYRPVVGQAFPNLVVHVVDDGSVRQFVRVPMGAASYYAIPA